MSILFALVFLTVCLILFIRLIRYQRITQSLIELKKHNNDYIYFYKKVKQIRWLKISSQEERETWKITRRDLNEKGLIGFYPGSIKDNSILNSTSPLRKEDIDFPIFRCRCQDCKKEFNCSSFCEFMINIKNRDVLIKLLKLPRNKKGHIIFPKYCFWCVRKNKLNLNYQQSLKYQQSILDDSQNINSNGTRLCLLCFDKEVKMNCLPCNHNCYCKTCSRKVVKKSKKRNNEIIPNDICNRCPICRKNITHFEQIK